MVRARQDKTASKPQRSLEKFSKKTPKNGTNLSKTEILALGGNEEDYDLLTNINDVSAAGPSHQDVSLLVQYL